MQTPAPFSSPWDSLPAELVVAVASVACTAPAVLSIGSTCTHWRVAVGAHCAMLWKLVTLASFPRVSALLRAKPSALPWLEIYRRQQLPRPKPRPVSATDFVLSFEVRKGEQILAEGSAPLEPLKDGRSEAGLSSEPLWEIEQAPRCLVEDWAAAAEQIPEYNGLFATEPKPLLNVWLTRDMQTLQLLHDRVCDDASEGAYPDVQSLGHWSTTTLPLIREFNADEESDDSMPGSVGARFDEASHLKGAKLQGESSPWA